MMILPACRTALRRGLVPISLGLSAGTTMIIRQPPLRLDSVQRSVPSRPMSSDRRGGLDPEVVKQVTRGSISGFALGFLVSVFSRTIVLLVGVGIVAIQVASRYGVDLVGQWKLKQRIDSSRILSSLVRRPAFGVSFGLTFALSAFMSF